MNKEDEEEGGRPAANCYYPKLKFWEPEIGRDSSEGCRQTNPDS